jgi:hypothetical protein
MAVPAHLTIKTDGLPFEPLLSDWRWLVQPNFAPVLMTAFGDLFLRGETGDIHFLDLMSGEFKQVAASQEEFDRLCDDREQRRSWFIGFLLMDLRKLRGELAAGECYSCKIPLSLGGQLGADNFDRVDLQVHYSILGQLHRQTRHLPPGTKINSIKIESPHEDKKPTSWWQRLVG